MSSYVMVFNFSGKGTENIGASPSRVDDAKKLCAQLGGEVKQFFGLMGARYDTMFVLEAPDDETAMKIAAAIDKKGNVHAETWRAFTDDEYRRILSDLPD